MIEIEIERKWLITADKDTVEKVLKNYDIKRSGELRQAYIIDKPVEVRLRHMRYNDGEEYYSLDNKIGTGLVRTELGNKISKEDYDFLISGGSTAYQLPADSSGNHNVASSNLRPGGTYTYREMLREKADL